MYEPFYSFKAKPFQLSPDPAFYYGSRVHKRAHAYLEYGLYQGEGFIVITGEVGAGKTTLVRNLLANLNSAHVVAAHLVSSQLDADDLLRAVGNAFGLATRGSDKASLLDELERFLRTTASERKRALLIVDEAQNLTPRAVEELRMLSNFQSGQRALLQSFLIGQPELRRILQGQDMQQFRQRVIASYHLGPLDDGETRHYIEHRLRQVGWVNDPRLMDDAYGAIYAFTAGIPRRINMVCNRVLLSGFLNEKHVLDAADVESVVNEFKEELGLGARREAAPARGREEASAELALEAESARALPVELDGSVRNGELQQRVARLEHSQSQVVGMLRRLARALEPVAKQVNESRL